MRGAGRWGDMPAMRDALRKRKGIVRLRTLYEGEPNCDNHHNGRQSTGNRAGFLRGVHTTTVGDAPGRHPPSLSGYQACFHVTEKFSPPDREDVVAFVVEPETMLIWSGP
ncbi:hypothetical protein SAMN05414137_119133 [Streptacidiphilus jiangxiensis]|uniref:Uncharacterized protein n=1 Tax=Streptacidiphilus jiangxiensis TaxID=235985 RepID=A0A1H7W210_STRJI|nr:hypothetical protein SAMN05414137_119133 [Streptacidiphilus jiangxiensis]